MSGINPQDEVKFYLTAVDEVTPVLDKLPEKARDTKKKLAKETIIQYHTDIANLREELDKVRKAIRKEKDPEIRLNLRIKEQSLSQAKTELNRQLNNYVNTGDIHLSRLQAKFNGIKTGFLALVDRAKGAAIGAIGALGKAVVNLADNYEKAKLSFTTMLGSASQATKLLSELSHFAKGTPFGLTEIRENAKQLLAMNIQSSKLIPTLKMLGDISAGLNVPLQRLALNYGQVMTKGKLAGQELKDFTTAGVPLLDELSKNLGKSKAEIQSMISKGEISANDVTRAFETMTSEGGRFADLMAQQSGTLSGMRSNFLDSLTQIGEKIGSYLLPGLKESVDWLQRLFNPPQNETEDEIVHLDARVREFQKVVAQVEREIEELNEKFRNGKISTDEYDTEFERLSGMLAVAKNSISEVNKEIGEQNALLEISDDLSRVHTETLTDLNDQENKAKQQLSDLSEQYREGILTEEEYLEQKKMLIEEIQNLKKAKDEENKASEKEDAVYKALKESGMKAIDIKSTLAGLRIENGQDIKNLNNEQNAANATAMSYIAMAKAKAQASVLEKKKKLNSFGERDKKWRGVFADMKDDLFGGEGSSKNVKLLRDELKKEEEFLSSLEDIEKEQNAFLTNRGNGGGKNPNKDDDNSPKGGGTRKNYEKEKIEQLKKSLKEQRDIEVKGIQESLLDEETKAKKLTEIKEKYDERIKQIDGKTVDEMLKNAQEYTKKVKDSKDKSLKEDQKVVDKMLKIFRDGRKKMKKEATSAFKEVEKEKNKLTKDHKKDLGERYADIAKSVKERERDNSGLKWITDTYSLKDLELMNETKDAKINDIDVDTIIQQVKELAELKLLEEKLTEEERKKSVELSNQSETQKLINKQKEEELILTEKMNILKAVQKSNKDENGIGKLGLRYDEEKDEYFYTDLEGKEQKITDIKNQALAQQYLDKETAIQNQAIQELEGWQKRLNGEKNNAIEIAKVHRLSTKTYQKELNRREELVRAHVDHIKAMMAEIGMSGSSAGSVINNNQVTNSNNRTTNYNITNISSKSSSFSGVGLK